LTIASIGEDIHPLYGEESMPIQDNPYFIDTLADSSWEALLCFGMLIILFFVFVVYTYSSREKILYFLKHRSLPERQMRVCPGCGSTILIPLGPDNVKCNDCGAIFAATRNVVDYGKVND
jgi:ribosomal protein L37AE/L43A